MIEHMKCMCDEPLLHTAFERFVTCILYKKKKNMSDIKPINSIFSKFNNNNLLTINYSGNNRK